MSTYKKGDRVVVTGPANSGTEWLLPAGDVAEVREDERYGHVRIDSLAHPKQYAPFWQYPVTSVKPA